MICVTMMLMKWFWRWFWWFFFISILVICLRMISMKWFWRGPRITNCDPLENLENLDGHTFQSSVERETASRFVIFYLVFLTFTCSNLLWSPHLTFWSHFSEFNRVWNSIRICNFSLSLAHLYIGHLYIATPLLFLPLFYLYIGQSHISEFDACMHEQHSDLWFLSTLECI